MEESKKETPTYPYPLRSSELVQQEELFAKVEPIVLTDKERQELLDFEQELFKKLEPLRKLTPDIHVVYPDYFLTEEGWRLFQLVYLDPDLKKRTAARAEKEGISLEREKEKKRFYDPIFDELQETAKSEESFARYKAEEKVEIKEVKKPERQKEVVRLFFSLEDLAEVPRQIRRRIASVTSDHARDRFLEEFQAQKGDVEKISDPYRASRVVDIDKLIDKVGGYREFKRELKGLIRESREKEGNVPEAKAVLAQIYLRYLNTLIAGSYRFGRVLVSKPELSAEEKQALDLVRGIRSTFKVNAEQAKRMAELILSAYGFDKRGWTVYVSPTKKTFSVSYREKGEIIKNFNIPESLDRGLVDTLVSLEHEASHVLQHDNREQGMGELALIEEFSTGRVKLIREAGAMWVSDQTKRQLVKMPRLGLPYYGLMLLEKQKGGSFKDCYRVYLENYARIKLGRDLNGLLENKKEWEDISKRAFSYALRIFARCTPLEDKSGFLPTSKQLQYLEQELVAETLFKEGWGKILFTAGIDLYSLCDLTRLGMLDWDEIREPRFWVAKELWPKLRREIDQGKSLDEAIEAIQK